MKVLLYSKDDPKAAPVEREAVDAREILADPKTLYTLTPGEPNATPPSTMIDGMSPAGMQLVSDSGLTAEELSLMTFEEVGVRLDLKTLNDRDVSALRVWHAGLADRRKRLQVEKPPQPGEKRESRKG